jgi:hypothetical protein
MSEGETKKDSEVGPRQWVPSAEFLKMLQGLPPDPSLMDDLRELDETLDDLGDPWER